MTNGVVSIVIPTRNRRELLAETLDSIRDQTYPHWEAIVVDDGSDDGTAEMVQAISGSESRIRLLSRPGASRGAPACRNAGLEASSGEFIVFFDSDDLMHRDCLARRVAVMNSNPDLDFCVFHTELFASTPGDLGVLWNTLSTAPDLPRFLCEDTPWQTLGPIWRRRFLDSTQLRWDTTAVNWQDWEFHVRALMQRSLYMKVGLTDHYVRRSARDPGAISSQSGSHAKLTDRIRTYVRIACDLHSGDLELRRHCWMPLLLFHRVAGQLITHHSDVQSVLSQWRNVRSHRLISAIRYFEGAVSYRLLALRVFRPWVARWLQMRWASDFDRHVRGVSHTALAPGTQWRSDAVPTQLFAPAPMPTR